MIGADVVAVLVEVAAIADTGGKTLLETGRPQPPKAVAVGAMAIRSTSIRILGRFTLSCAIGAEVLICFGNA